MTSVTVPYSDVGKASFEQLDTWLQQFYLAGDTPELASYPFQAEMGQTLAQFAVVGLNARHKLVPATVTDARHYFVTSAAVAAGGTGGTPGAVTLTGTTGTGTKFQATGVISAGGVLTSITAVTVEGDYTVTLTDATVEPVTGGSLTGATLNVVVEHVEVLTAGVQAIGVLTQPLTTAAGDDTQGVPVWFSGCFNIRALVWDASFTNDEAKFNAFRGAPTPTTITVKQRQSDV